MWQVVFCDENPWDQVNQGDDQAHADQQKEKHQNSSFLKKKRYFIFEKNLSGHHGKYKHFAGLPISIVEFAHLFT